MRVIRSIPIDQLRVSAAWKSTKNQNFSKNPLIGLSVGSFWLGVPWLDSLTFVTGAMGVFNLDMGAFDLDMGILDLDMGFYELASKTLYTFASKKHHPLPWKTHSVLFLEKRPRPLQLYLTIVYFTSKISPPPPPPCLKKRHPLFLEKRLPHLPQFSNIKTIKITLRLCF